MAFKGRQMWKIWLLKLFVLIISSPYKRQSNILLVVIQNLGQGGRKGDVLAFHPYGSSFGCQCKKTNQPNKQTKPTKPTNQPKIKPPHSIYSNYIITIIKIITNCGVTALESIFLYKRALQKTAQTIVRDSVTFSEKWKWTTVACSATQGTWRNRSIAFVAAWITQINFTEVSITSCENKSSLNGWGVAQKHAQQSTTQIVVLWGKWAWNLAACWCHPMGSIHHLQVKEYHFSRAVTCLKQISLKSNLGQ